VLRRLALRLRCLPAQSELGAAARQYTALLLALRAQARGAAALAAAAEARRAGVALPPLAHFAVLSALTRAGDASGSWSEARASQSLSSMSSGGTVSGRAEDTETKGGV
jgi:hypothetical protein